MQQLPKLLKGCWESSMQKARKFKRKLAPKPIRKKDLAVLSVELIRKETLEKIRSLVNKFLSFTKGLKVTR